MLYDCATPEAATGNKLAGAFRKKNRQQNCNGLAREEETSYPLSVCGIGAAAASADDFVPSGS